MSKRLTVSKSVKVEPFAKFAPKGVLPKKFRAAVGVDKAGRPAWFLFDRYAFWELLCRIDEKLLSKLSDEEYAVNPVGRLIDEIEADWPLDPKAVASIKREFELALKDIAAGSVSPL